MGYRTLYLARLRVLVVFLLPVMLCACPGPSESRQRLVLEFDYVNGLSPFWASEDASLEERLKDVEIELVPEGSSFEPDPYDECATMATLHNQIEPAKDPDLDVPSGDWYAHGLVVPCCSPGDDAPSPNATCTDGIPGTIWFLEGMTRETFFIFNDAMDSDEEGLEYTLEELGHVLNLHHADFGQDCNEDDECLGSYGYGNRSRDHLLDHQSSRVRPGPTGDEFCEILDWHEESHDSDECSDLVWSSSSSIVSAQVTLDLWTEKTYYLPSEPVHVDLRLARGPSSTAGGTTTAIPFRSERSLDPAFGYMTLWAAQWGAGDNVTGPPPTSAFRRLGVPIYSDAPAVLESEMVDLRPGESFVSSGRGAWYSLRYAQIDEKRSFWIIATFSGFEDPSLVVASKPQPVTVIEQPTLYDPHARARFARPESRKFLFLSGGGHLERGIDDLEAIVADHQETVYAAYSHLALGASWIYPFVELDADGTVTRRERDYGKAQTHLDEADARRELLSRSYRRQLDVALATVREDLGDSLAATDPVAARGHYEDALGRLEEVSATCRPKGTPISFTPKTITNAAIGARSVAVADINGDGALDILSASGTDNTIRWHESKAMPSINFTSAVISHNALGATSVAAADLDGDGDAEVLSAARTNNQIASYALDPAGATWTAKTIAPLAMGATSVFAADLDGDGHQDVLSASAGDNTIAWFENDLGNGQSWVRRHIALDAQGAQSVSAADVDGDGDMDVLSASVSNNTVAWYENTGSGPAIVWVPHVVSSTTTEVQAVFAADVDGDGDQDILSAAAQDDVTWHENLNRDGSSWAHHAISTAMNGARSVFAVDMDCDGDQDVLSVSSQDDMVLWHENVNGNGTVWTDRIISGAANGARSVLAADLDEDGDLDVVSASAGDNSINWYENNGSSPLSVTEKEAKTRADARRATIRAKITSLP